MPKTLRVLITVFVCILNIYAHYLLYVGLYDWVLSKGIDPSSLSGVCVMAGLVSTIGLMFVGAVWHDER